MLLKLPSDKMCGIYSVCFAKKTLYMPQDEVHSDRLIKTSVQLTKIFLLHLMQSFVLGNIELKGVENWRKSYPNLSVWASRLHFGLSFHRESRCYELSSRG